ncbi:MAG TPA: hypothetical protein ENK16_06650, partial [Chromatiales bacterium]|nr:hypothetical protein [Chromatiales bacterium]
LAGLIAQKPGRQPQQGLAVQPVSFSGRVSASLLQHAGLPELVADDETAYVDLARSLASDPARLGELRQSLRGQLEQSELMDLERFVDALENCYRDIWRNWCRHTS